MVRSGEVIFGPVSGKKPWFNPSILEYGNQKGKAEYGYRRCNIKHSLLMLRNYRATQLGWQNCPVKGRR